MISAVLAAALALAGPSLQVSQVADLTDGQKITVTGTGFRPGLQSVAVGLCRAGYTGPKDCDLVGGATFVNINGQGALPPVTLTARTRFGGTDCAARQCVIGVAPLPGAAPPAIVTANTAVLNVGFQGSAFKGGAAQVVTPSATPAGSDGPSTTLWAITLGVLVLTGAAISRTQRRH